MSVIWHHNDSVQVELAAVFLQAALKDKSLASAGSFQR
jgi:hypothetical protein